MVGVASDAPSVIEVEAVSEEDALRLRHVPALDGLRGIAVLAVLAFHAGHLRGGYLGVDLFFVLSGFLITTLLVIEWEARQTISLGRFWSRRARRLLPALFALVAAVSAAAALFPELAVPGLRADALATLGYVANWRFVFADNGYWDAFESASPLEHAWSLAIEEQFYVVWPVVVFAALQLAGRRGLAAVTGVLAVASAAAMVVMFDPSRDPSRIYFGTDTRAASILAGALLALVTARRPWSRQRRRSARAAGEAAFVVFALMVVFLDGTSPRLYRGGFVLSALTGVALVAAAAVGSNGPLKSFLSSEPLQLVGRVSYGLYLWHWPVFLVLDADRVGLGGTALTGVRLVATSVVTAASYLLLELPIRRGAFRDWRPFILLPAAVAAAVLAVILLPAPGPGTEVAASARGVTTPAEPRVLIVGDAMASSLADALDSAGGFDVVRAVAEGCTAVRADGFRETPAGPPSTACVDARERWAAAAANVDADAVLVAFGWTGEGDHLVQGAWKHPCAGGFDLYYESEVEALVGEVAPAGTPVLISTLPLETDGGPLPDFNRADCLNSVYRRVAAGRSLGSVLDIASPLCFNSCPPGEDGVVRSGVHLSLDAHGIRVLREWAPTEISTLVDAMEDAAGAPVEILLLGDSTALKLGEAFTTDAAGGAAVLRSHGQLGCGVTPGLAYAAGRPLEKPHCETWPREWAAAIERTRPDVVLVMLGAWEVLDHQVDGDVFGFGDAAWETAVREGLASAAEVASAAGVPVVLLNSPCFRQPDQPFTPTPERNEIERVRQFNAILDGVASEAGATVVDLESFLCPNGRYQHERGGVLLRRDGVHLTPGGGAIVWRWLAPQVVDLAGRHRDAAASSATPASTTIATSDGTRKRANP